MLKELIKACYFIPSPTINLAAKKNIEKIKKLISVDRPLILNVGCGERFIGGERLKGYRIINTDIIEFSDVELISDAHFLPFRDESFDLVICQAVLEHTRKPWLVVNEIYRVLKKEGVVYVEVPFLQGFHASPTDYYRFTLQGIEEILSVFEKIDSDLCVGSSSALSWILREYLTGIFSFANENSLIYKINYFFWSWLTFPIKYFDFILARKAFSYKIASGVYFIGKKVGREKKMDKRSRWVCLPNQKTR